MRKSGILFLSQQRPPKTVVKEFSWLEGETLLGNKIHVSNKEYVVDLGSHDFSNIYSHQLIYYLDDKGIRSMMK